jgi:hypothetical protein
MIRKSFALLRRTIGRSLASAPGQMKQELARQGRMGSYELGAALFSQSNAYRGDLGLHSIQRPEARQQQQVAPKRGLERS